MGIDSPVGEIAFLVFAGNELSMDVARSAVVVVL